jgi:hypothetical protein
MRKFILPSIISSIGLFTFIHTSSAQLSSTSTSSFYSESKNLNCATYLPHGSNDEHIKIIKNWSAFVSNQAFSIPPQNTDNYLRELRTCFSSNGWDEFTRALKQSGNLALIQAKQFNSSSQVIGLIAVTHQANSNIWETRTPIQVIYQNDSSKITQELIVHLRVVREGNNRLTVSQIVGIPKNL